MKATITSGLLWMILALAPLQSYAFGHEGHRIVATVAMYYLAPETRQNIQRILGNTSPEEAATWMDDVRTDPAYDFMKNWHFINIEKGKTYVPGGQNIVSVLERVYNELQQPAALSKKARKEDLMILFHLMGDLHQPLHVGYASDRGGNDVPVRFNGKPTDLHHVWDVDIIESLHITAEACLKLSNITAKDIARTSFSPAQFVAFMNDSRDGLPTVYGFTGGKIDATYINSNRQVVMFQLQHAGMRLASVLQHLFGPAPSTTPPVKVTEPPVPPVKSVSIAITPDEARWHGGESVRVCGKVYGGNVIERSGVTYINMGAPYPNSPLTLVIQKEDLGHFPNKPASFYDGKTICVSGEITVINKKAEISVSGRGQISIP